MSARFFKAAVAFCLMAVMFVTGAATVYAVSADVVMKVSRTAQDSIINEGEDLSISLSLDGAVPASYRWYFGDEPIVGANFSTYTILSADITDAGVYRVEAFDENGGMIISMEFNVRVIEEALPKSGDGTLDAGLLTGIIAAAGLTLVGAAAGRKRSKVA